MRSVLAAMLGTRCLAWILAGAIVLVGCDAQRPANAPIATQDFTKGYRLQRVKADPDNPGDVLVILTLSGGGTRAAALAYGTMEALRDVKLRMGAEAAGCSTRSTSSTRCPAAASSPPTTRSIGKDSSAISSPDS
jgi:hypothetical protein